MTAQKPPQKSRGTVLVFASVISLFLLVIPAGLYFLLLNPIIEPATNQVELTSEPSPTNQVQIGFISNFDADTKKLINDQLALDPQFKITELVPETDLTDLGSYSLIVLAQSVLESSQIQDIAQFYQNGGSIFWFAGEDSDQDLLLLKALGVITDEGGVQESTDLDQAAILEPVDEKDPLVSGIQWSSSPEAKKYQIISGFSDGFTPVLEALDTDTAIMFRFDQNGSSVNAGKFVGLSLIYTSEANKDFQLWPYTPYFFYRVVMWMDAREPLSYADWEYSPTPHAPQRIWLIIYLGIIFILGYGGFAIAKKRSKIPLDQKYMEKLKQVARVEKKKDESSASPGVENPEGSPNGSGTPENGTQIEVHEDLSNKWEQIGLHRQISSFFISLFVGLLVAAPYLVLSMFVYPRYIMPFPQTQGWVNWTSGFFTALFVVFDFGTATALQKFFSEYRIHEPAKAIKYAQIFVWWQILTGCVQITLVTSLGAYVLNESYLGHMTYFFILSSLAQFPGMLNVVALVLESMQRFDVKIFWEIFLGATVTNIVNYTTIYIFRIIFRDNVQYGEAFGAGVGIVVGNYLAQIVNFLIFAMVFKRLGFSIGTLFRVDFDKANLKQSLTFGGKLVAGNVWVPLVSLLEITLISMYVLNYNAEMGYLNMMKNITGAIGLLGIFFSSLMPAISEAHGNGKMKLTEYYLVEAIKWTNFILFMLIAALLAAGDKILITFAGEAWFGALKYLPLLILFGLFEPWAWFADRVFQGTNNTKYNMIVWIIEQGTRSLLLILIFVVWGQKQMQFLFLAYIPGIIAKDVSAFMIIRKKVCAFRWYWMHTFIVPIIGSLIIYGLINLIATFLWDNTLPTTIALFFIAIFGGLFIYAFVTGLLGGWDDNTITEFRRGVEMIKTVRFIFNILVVLCEWGHRLCPWKNKFAVDVYEEAKQEADTLTREKQKLII